VRPDPLGIPSRSESVQDYRLRRNSLRKLRAIVGTHTSESAMTTDVGRMLNSRIRTRNAKSVIIGALRCSICRNGRKLDSERCETCAISALAEPAIAIRAKAIFGFEQSEFVTTHCVTLSRSDSRVRHCGVRAIAACLIVCLLGTFGIPTLVP